MRDTERKGRPTHIRELMDEYFGRPPLADKLQDKRFAKYCNVYAIEWEMAQRMDPIWREARHDAVRDVRNQEGL